ncbi:hypothetical protein SAMN05445060_2343 [Williamsia sterculiae]|uniref:DUF4878 domain-containing protein n=1 Tax=Williamsia sterculiae TaxID=1344003 RepID=A0A1N7FWE4_9NOCA|nr:hypothetical protein [Williamsia sterculiae]SIS04555.1 hypothetical protein SAMN05445060_2343 [Williamsia sterculiae]
MVILAAIAVIAAVAVTATLLLWHRDPSDSDRITAAAQKYVAAVGNGDNATVVSLLCGPEADAQRDDALQENLVPEGAGSDSETGNDNGSRHRVTVQNVQIRGQVASARVVSTPGGEGTLFFREEDKSWKVCDEAAEEFGQQR